jgi:hypothetical protein
MNYAKVKHSSLIKYPYTFADLREENPYTRYDNRYTLSEWYAKTEEGRSSGNSVVEVKTAELPVYEEATHYLKQKTAPELVANEWVLGWDIIERTVLDSPVAVDSSSSTNIDPTAQPE